MRQLKFNKATISKILKFFNVKKVKIIVKKMKEYGRSDKEARTIYIDKEASQNNKILILVHELIHYSWRLDHNPLGWYCGYYSSKHDHFSEVIASVIFKRKFVWEDG